MSWIQRAKPGDKVVCIRTWFDDERAGRRDEAGPVAGEVYTIREVGFFHPEHPHVPTLRLVEIVNPVRNYRYHGGRQVILGEACFGAFRFRPADPRKTDISFAHEILRMATQPALEDA